LAAAAAAGVEAAGVEAEAELLVSAAALAEVVAAAVPAGEEVAEVAAEMDWLLFAAAALAFEGYLYLSPSLFLFLAE
jgi:hypothetical protein